MDFATIQQKIYDGYGKAALRIGPTYNVYRATSFLNPISAPNWIGSTNASFNIGGTYNGQSKANQLYWQAIVDASVLQVGDILVGPETYVMVAMDPLMPPIALRCTQTLNFMRPIVDNAPGAQPYPNPQMDTAYATGIPGVLTVKKETGRPDPQLPTDNALRAFYGAFFWLPDGTVLTRDQVTDENGDNYQVVSAQKGLLGYEALLELVEA